MSISPVYSINGNTIVQNKLTPLTFTTVSLFKSDTSTFIQTIISDTSGSFVFTNVPIGNYYLKATHIGYNDTLSTNFVLNGDTQIKMILSTRFGFLKDVTVTGQKRLIQSIPGGFVFDAKQNLIASNGETIDLLKQVPGTIVDADGTIKLIGNNVTILIDGRKVNINGPELANYLKSIPASNVSSIEVLTNPPAKYDAGGGGIIDIKLKKSIQAGLWGNFTATGSSVYSIGTNGNVNYNVKSFRIALGYSITHSDDEATRMNREILYYGSVGNGDLRNNQSERAPLRLTTQMYSASIDYEINKRNTIGVILKYNPTRTIIPANLTSNQYGSTGLIKNYFITNRKFVLSSGYALFDINYIKKFKKEGRGLTIELNHAPFSGDLTNKFNQQYYTLSGTIDGNNNTTHNNTDYRYGFSIFKADYSHQLNDKSKIEIGTKNSYTNIMNDFRSDTLNYNANKFEENKNISNYLEYTENIAAAYVSYSQQIKHFFYQAGVRFEDTRLRIKSRTIGQEYKQQYDNLFPSINLKYSVKDANSFSLDLSRRIQRPSYDMYNPFLNTSNPNYYLVGNPYLKPSHILQLQLKHIKYWGESHMLISSIFFSSAKEIFASLVTKDPTTDILKETGDNYLNGTSLGISLSSQDKITKWWNINLNLIAYRAQFRSKRPETGNMPLNVFFNFNIMNNFIVKKNTRIQVSGNYNSRRRYGQFLFNPTGNVDLGVQHSFLNPSLDLSLTLNDIFYTIRNDYSIETPKYYMFSSNRYTSRFVSLRISYNFGKSNNKNSRNIPIEENERRKLN